MAVFCENCRRWLDDDGAPLIGRVCGVCGSNRIARIPPAQPVPPKSALAGAVIGALLSSALFGPEALILGALVGAIIGDSTKKPTK